MSVFTAWMFVLVSAASLVIGSFFGFTFLIALTILLAYVMAIGLLLFWDALRLKFSGGVEVTNLAVCSAFVVFAPMWLAHCFR